MVKTRITVDAYIAEYARGKYWDASAQAVRFPSHTDIYEYVYNVLRRRPRNASPIDRGNLEIVLPDKHEGDLSYGKSPEQFNYISERGSMLLNKRLKSMFWAEVHEAMDEGKHIRGLQYKDIAYMFVCRYDISSISDDSLMKNYQRWRDNMRRQRKRSYTIRKKR